MADKKVKKNRLSKRQEEYLKQFNIFANAKEDDPFYTEKRAVSTALKNLNKKIAELNPEPDIPDQDNQPKKKLTTEEIAALAALYEQAINSIDAFSTKVGKSIEDQNGVEEKKLVISQNTTLANIMGKDLNVLNAVSKDDNVHTLDDIYEKSRVNSSYRVELDYEAQKTAGAQNERIPVTLVRGEGENQVKIEGYFTPDNVAPGKERLAQAVKEVKEKYGKSADFINQNMLEEFREEMAFSNSSAYANIFSKKEQIMFMKPEKARDYLTKNLDKKFRKYFDTPEKTKIMVDALNSYSRAFNADSIINRVGIREGLNVNRRNSSMSAVAELLGCSNLIAYSENVSIKLDGVNESKGTFMVNADGDDMAKADPDNLFSQLSGGGAVDSLPLKKQLADLQVLDFICGNPDRHGYNMLYKFGKDAKGRPIIIGIQGIDNDTSFGEKYFSEAGLSRVLPEQMNVITREMAERIMNLTPDKLKQMLYGKKLTKSEIDNATERLTTLQKKIIDDQKEYAKGYTKGYLIPGRIKIVDDGELDELRMSDLSKTPDTRHPNLFRRLNACSSGEYMLDDMEKTFQNDYYKKACAATMDMLGDLGKIIKKMQDDKGGPFSSSSKYDEMLQKMETLQKGLLNMSGPLIGEGVNLKNGHTKMVTDVKKQMEEALMSVFDYRDYKMAKEKGEEWRNIEGEHVADRTERRYHHTMDALSLLEKHFEAFKKLDKSREDYLKYNKKVTSYKYQAQMRENEYKSLDGAKKDKKMQENIRENHMSRCMYQIMEAYNQGKEMEGKKVVPDRIDGAMEGLANKEECDLQFDVMVGFALLNLDKKERAELKKRIEDSTGIKVKGTDEEIVKRAVASHLVLQSKLIERKPENKRIVPESSMIKAIKKIEAEDVKKTVEKILGSPAFEKTFSKNVAMLKRDEMMARPGINLMKPIDANVFAEELASTMRRQAKMVNLQNKEMKQPGKN